MMYPLLISYDGHQETHTGYSIKECTVFRLLVLYGGLEIQEDYLLRPIVSGRRPIAFLACEFIDHWLKYGSLLDAISPKITNE